MTGRNERKPGDVLATMPFEGETLESIEKLARQCFANFVGMGVIDGPNSPYDVTLGPGTQTGTIEKPKWRCLGTLVWLGLPKEITAGDH